MTISYEDFSKVDIRSGTIIRAEIFERARKPAFKIWVDFGDKIGVKQTSAQVTVHYSTLTLVGKRVAGVVNLGTKNIAGFESQFLLLGFGDNDGNILLVEPENRVPNGKKLH